MTSPNMNMHIESQTCGLRRLRRMFDGTSKRMYGTKKMTIALLYCKPVSPRSFWSPNMDAFEMLTLLGSQ
jgi:hypothetical protein